MADVQASRFITLLHREFREYKNSLFWTPVVTAVLLALLMLGSVVLVNKFSFLGNWVLERMIEEGGNGMSVSISVGENGGDRVIVIDDDEGDLGDSDIALGAPTPPKAPDYQVFIEKEMPDEEVWNFSREWSFNPDTGVDENGGGDGESIDIDGRELNTMLSVLHIILLLILVLTSANYLLSSLFDDRKDRSILFWRSMPVSEREIVLSKFVTALIVAPLIYIGISLILQLTWVLLMMLLVWRMDEDPFAVVLQNIDFVALMTDPISGWVLAALLVAPAYAWLLCASAFAKRSPFLMAVTPIIALFIGEGVIFGSEHIGNAVSRHVPHVSDESAVGFYLFGPDWTRVDLISVVAGLAFAAALIAVTVWLRKHRWELN